MSHLYSIQYQIKHFLSILCVYNLNKAWNHLFILFLNDKIMLIRYQFLLPFSQTHDKMNCSRFLDMEISARIQCSCLAVKHPETIERAIK